MPQSFTRGLLTSVDGFAPSIQYHPNGTVQQVRHANGVDWLQRADPDDMQRPARINTSGAIDSAGASAELDTGLYGFDGAGRVTRIGADRYAYDRFGNGTKTATDGSTRTTLTTGSRLDRATGLDWTLVAAGPAG